MTRDTTRIKRLWGYLKPYWHLEVLTFLVMMVLAGLALALPHAVRYMIDNLIPSLVENPRVSAVFYFGLVLAGLFLANVLFSWLRDYLAAYIGANIIAAIRSELFYHLERLSLRFYHTHQVGEMMSRLLSDVNRVQNLLTSTVLMFLTSVLMVVAMLIYLVSVNWMLTLIAIIPVPLTILLTNRFGRKLHHITRALQETIARLSARLQESFLSIRTIKAFGQEQREKRKVDKVLADLTGLYVKNSVTSSLSVNLVNFVNMLGPVVVLAWGTYLVAGGTMKLGALIAFYMLLTYLYSPIQSLASTHIEVQAAMASVNRIFEYLDIPPAVTEIDNPVTLRRADGEIVFKDVAFSYNGGSFKLENFNLAIRPKEKVAIVGPSGAGKTTLINLIMRFYDPRAGCITLDGVDIRTLSLKSLRDNIALVDQEPLLFRTSIFNNIAYSNPNASREEVIRAAQVANIHDYIAGLPNGYDSEVGERGITLSGGEKQRICLARAVLKNPSVLILDEATSALDSNSEQLIQESLKRILADKTAIIIAHRLSTVQHADRIIALDNGKIVDEGKHEELLVSSPLYRELAEKQLKI
jgi:ABC-type multidrug transport system fused ATPase/permease subunit